ncbi:MAG TPA: type I glutamate--ammonia ligase [Amycolatopsis sp.]|nr:type I glutamate--ammonia ligase [Amycolatopsis sp.]HKS48903.1 type I glutamate--ammonia ligase [Amycolatopsis sp.]
MATTARTSAPHRVTLTSEVGKLLDLIRQANIQVVDVKFCDLPGTWQHFSIPAATLDEEMIREGLGFDGSSIRGFQAINESDMLLLPDVSTAFVDPVLEVPTLSLTCDIYDPLTLEPYSRDPRFIAFKAEEYLRTTGIATTSYWGPEAEFFIFNNVRFDQNAHEAFYHIDAEEGVWNSGRNGGSPNLGHRPRHKEGYFPVPPVDRLQDVRSKIMLALIKAGVPVEVQHHEVATAGQAEIDFRFGTLVQTADRLMVYKYIIKNVCHNLGYTATFMPKPLFGDNGSGMHCHQSLWKDGSPLFYDESGYAGLSDTARHYLGGILAHAPSLLAFTNPTVNSYHRLVPGFEAPVSLVYSQRNRSACVRVPVTGSNAKAKRIEFRCPDSSGNPYLAFAAMVMAGLDGIKNKIEPPEPIDKDLYELPPEEAKDVKQVPASLDEVLDNLEADHDFLTEGGVFTSDVIETWISYKREAEIDPLRLRPHPYEFALYYDV